MNNITQENVDQLKVSVHRITLMLRYNENSMAHTEVYEIKYLPSRIKDILTFLSTRSSTSIAELKEVGFEGSMDLAVVDVMSLYGPAEINIQTHLCKWIVDSLAST